MFSLEELDVNISLAFHGHKTIIVLFLNCKRGGNVIVPRDSKRMGRGFDDDDDNDDEDDVEELERKIRCNICLTVTHSVD